MRFAPLTSMTWRRRVDKTHCGPCPTLALALPRVAPPLGPGGGGRTRAACGPCPTRAAAARGPPPRGPRRRRPPAPRPAPPDRHTRAQRGPRAREDMGPEGGWGVEGGTSRGDDWGRGGQRGCGKAGREGAPGARPAQRGGHPGPPFSEYVFSDWKHLNQEPHPVGHGHGVEHRLLGQGRYRCC